MPTKNELESAQRVLTRSRFMRDRHIKSVQDICSLAAKVENNEADKLELEVRLDSLNNMITQFRKEEDFIVDSLIVLGNVEEFETFDAPITASMDVMYFESRRIISRVFSQKVESVQSSHSLPKIQLPKFNGDVVSWCTFRDTFKSLVHETPNIGNIDRFHYLVSCLTGPASSIVSALPPSESNYSIAWTTLCGRFNNQRLLATAHLEKLFAFRPMSYRIIV